jgi:hypothetical protein
MRKVNMTQEVYNKLADALNARSMTYPSVPCDEFYSLAEELFTPEQAEICLKHARQSGVGGGTGR